MKDIKGYEGLYAITENGQVWSYRRSRFLKPFKRKGGYLAVGLCNNGKTNYYLIHRLVAEAFIPNPENKPQVNHKDENKANNCIENLEWATASENINYGTRNKRVGLANSRAIQCVETGVIYLSAVEAGKQLGVSNKSISNVLRNKSHTAGGYHWKYVEVI